MFMCCPSYNAIAVDAAMPRFSIVGDGLPCRHFFGGVLGSHPAAQGSNSSESDTPGNSRGSVLTSDKRYLS
jgi:hypothetical protein